MECMFDEAYTAKYDTIQEFNVESFKYSTCISIR